MTPPLRREMRRRTRRLASPVAGWTSPRTGLMKLRRRINVPETMSEVVKDEADVMSKLDALVDKAFADVCTPFTPRMPSREEMRSLILEVYHGACR